MPIKIYILFIILYFNLKTHSIALVLESFGVNSLTIKPFRVEVEVDNILIVAAIFNSFKNYRVYWIVRGYWAGNRVGLPGGVFRVFNIVYMLPKG